MATRSICIIGGGASGVGLAWCLARARQLGLAKESYSVTLLHNQRPPLPPGDLSAGADANRGEIGGHSYSVPVTVNGVTYDIDLGVQVIAPKMYPNLLSMLTLSEFADVTLQPVPLNISCAFPPVNGTTPYWGNFPAYQGTPLYRSRQADCVAFEKVLADAPLPMDTLKEFLLARAGAFQDLEAFEQYFLDPYMSIMNGYGKALLSQVNVLEIAPIFDFGYASFTAVGDGFQRFAKGSSHWVRTMLKLAKDTLGENLTVVTDATVEQLWPSDSGPTVRWCVGGASPDPKSFDVVVSTLDMNGNSKILNNANNKLWSFYEPFVGTPSGDTNTVWPLIPGYCYLHQDASLLAPGLPGRPQETLQFTAYWATQKQPYDITTTFTTYVERNLMSVEDPDFEYYLTMYGFDPRQQQGVPIPKKGVLAPTPMNWVHGMWLPFFMREQKEQFHIAQGISPYHAHDAQQHNTHIYFAGNNLTMDSEEGALVSALAVARYAFGIEAPILLFPPIEKLGWEYVFAGIEYAYLYHLMFPSDGSVPDGHLTFLRSLAHRW